MHANRRLIFIFIWVSVFLLSCFNVDVADASDDDIDCPGPGEAFVTTCSGSEPPHTNDETSTENKSFGESDIVNEVLEESKEDDYSRSRKAYKSGTSSANHDDRHHDYNSGEEAGFCDAPESPAVTQQMKQTIRKLTQKYYDPLPRQGKVCIGTVCGFTASRLSLGVANRLFRLAGATWVLSEVLHTSGFCDSAKCVPEEARPWVGILRRALVKQCIKVRMIARQLWDQDRIRGIVQEDEFVAGGFAAGAFVGFVV